MFEQATPLSAFGSTIERTSTPMPAGAKLSNELIDALVQLPAEMNLPMDGYLTPWATQDGLEWKARGDAPSENIAIYTISSREVREAVDKLFGQPIPFQGVVTTEPVTALEIEQAFEGTDYEWQDSIAVYEQVQTGEAVPPILYFHWIALHDTTEKRTKSLDQALAAVGGTLVFAERVSYSDTAVRDWPAMDFNTAMNSQLTEFSAEDSAHFNPEVAPTPPKSSGLLTGVLIAAGTAVGVVAVGELIRRSR